ncbi:hypothetical protein ACWZJV_05195 [Nocardioides sp. WG-D5]
MTDAHLPALNRGALPAGLHHFLIGWPDAARVGTATTPVVEAGPFTRPADAIESLAYYDLMLSEYLEPRYRKAIEYRVISRGRSAYDSWAWALLRRRPD